MRAQRKLPTLARLLIGVERWYDDLRRRQRRRARKPLPGPREILNGGGLGPIERRWVRLATEPLDDLLGELVGDRGLGPEDAMRRLFPALAGKRIADVPLETPATLSVESIEKGFPIQVLDTPLDWRADPLKLYDWRLWYQSLRWLDHVYKPEDGQDLERAAYIIVDWHDRIFPLEPPWPLTWEQHAVSVRLDAVWRFVEHYLQHRDVVDARVLRASIRILISHLYALAVEAYYVERHNHGLMQDRTLLIRAGQLAPLVDSPKLMALAKDRMLRRQLAVSVTSDFIHVENSPTYHFVFMRVLTQILDEAFVSQGLPPPPEIVRARDGMLATMLHFMRPDGNLAQFGDSLRGSIGPMLRKTLRVAARSVPFAAETLAEVSYVTSHGASGTQPAELDRVFEEGGYAAFRERWAGPDPKMAICAHFKSTSLSGVHYHQDETSFQIYGFGGELLIDPGRFANDRTRPMSRRGSQAKMHNLLIVNRQNFGTASEPPRIVGHGFGDNLAWVQGAHSYHRRFGVHGYTRSFVFFKPRIFLVIDSFRSTRENVYDQHFHLHPSLDTRKELGNAAVEMKRSDGAGLVLRPFLGNADVRIFAGDGGGSEQSWCFPVEGKAEPSPDVVYQRLLPRGVHHLPVVLALFAADEAPDAPELTLVSEPRTIRVRLSSASGTREVALPLVAALAN